MLKKICFLVLFVFSSSSWGKEENETEHKKSGYRYIIDNYFSKRRSSGTEGRFLRNFIIFSGLSFYRESTVKSFSPFSSFVLGFNQKIKEIPRFGDVNLQVAMFSSKMEKQKAVLLEITPQIIVPDIRSAFPLYVGLGAGLGFYPRYIVLKIPSLSVHGQFLVGLRFLDLYHNLGLSMEFNLRMQYPFSELEIYIETLGQLGLIFSF